MTIEQKEKIEQAIIESIIFEFEQEKRVTTRPLDANKISTLMNILSQVLPHIKTN